MTGGSLLLSLSFSCLLILASGERWGELEKALTRDIMPESSPECVGSGETSHSFQFTNSSSYGQWAAMSAPFENLVFLAQMNHKDSNQNRSWSIRFGKGGNMYSYYGAMGETVPPQYHTGAPWIDEVWQSVSVNTYLNNNPTSYYIHQAGTYMNDGITSPFYSPSLASVCVGRECRFASWGQQAHVPTTFTSNAIYYNRYRDCGNGVMEFTSLIHNAWPPGGDELDYINIPWGGVRTSTLPQLLMAPKSGGESQIISPIPGFGNGNIPNSQDTGGYITFSQEVTTNASTYFPLPCADAAGSITTCPGVGQVSLNLNRNPACRFESGTTDAWDEYTVSCGLQPTVLLKDGCFGCRLYFVNNRTDQRFLVNGVLHWAWNGDRMYLWPNVTVDVINSVFSDGDTITVQYAYFGVPRDQALALSSVFGQGLSNPVPSWRKRPSRIRYGIGGSDKRDYTVYTLNNQVNIEAGDSYVVRQYMLMDTLNNTDAGSPFWVPQVYQNMYARGTIEGQSVSLYADGIRNVFSAALTVDGCLNGEQVCKGSTTPQIGSHPLYYVTCGAEHYVGPDQYYFTPTASDGVLRPYICVGQASDVRGTWTLLGYFASDSCGNATEDSTLDKHFCDFRLDSGISDAAEGRDE
jgi:hypothetical protein